MRVSTSRTTLNWTNILPVIEQTGLGDFCIQGLELPESFVGERGVIQVMQDATDGVLHQVRCVPFLSFSATFEPFPCLFFDRICGALSARLTWRDKSAPL